jgi:integrase
MNDKGNPTVRELVKLYKQLDLDNLCEGSKQMIIYLTDIFVAEHGDKPLAEMRAIDLLKWVKEHPTWKSPWMQKRAMGCIKRVFNWCLENDLITHNPFIRVRYRGAAATRRRPMTDAEFQTLMRVSDPTFRRFLTFLKFTGCRPGEAAAMKWKDVRFDQGSVVLKDHKTAKKTGRPRVIPLVPTITKMLVWMREHRQASVIGLVERLLLTNGGRIKAVELFRHMKPYGISPRGVARAKAALGIFKERVENAQGGYWMYVLPDDHEQLPDPTAGDFVFINGLGNAFIKNCLSQKVRRARKRAGLPKHVTLYGLRHRYGLMGIKNGVNLKLLSLCMGHTRTQMTEHYIHEAGLTDQVQQAALQVAFGAGAVAQIAPPPPPRPIVVTTPPPAETIEAVTEHIPAKNGSAPGRPQVPIKPVDPLQAPMSGAKTEGLLQQILNRLADQPKRPRKQRTDVFVPSGLKPAEANAWQLYQWAMKENPVLAEAKDRDVFTWLQKQAALPAKLPPLFPTFARYIAAARLFHNCRKRDLYERKPLPEVEEESEGS